MKRNLIYILDTRCGKCASLSMALGLEKPFFCTDYKGDVVLPLPTCIEEPSIIEGCNYKKFTNTSPAVNTNCKEVLESLKNYILCSKIT